MTDWSVTAVRYATLDTTLAHAYHRFHSYGEPDGPIQLAYYFWVLRSPDETILVDSGFDPVAGARRGRTCLIEPQMAMAAVGVTPGTVSRIIVTHLHYDHTGNLDALPDAELLIAERELDFWLAPIAKRFQHAEHVETADIEYVRTAQIEGRVRALRGGEEVAPGVGIELLGGHSPGQLAVTVNTASGLVVLASDAIHFYEELASDRPFAVIADLERMYLAYDRLAQLSAESGARLVVGHDPEVLERFPRATGAAAEFAVVIE